MASKARDYGAVGILFAINLFNYMDRFAVPSVQINIQEYYGGVSDTNAGLIQTAFIVTYMFFSPICGYLGDRLVRKYIVITGLLAWVAVVYASTFVPAGADNFWYFLVLRALGGIGEASYANVAPTIIADMFAKDRRAQMLMIFFFAIPVGTGLGFISVSSITALTGQWQWGLRLTPTLTLIALVALVIVVREPRRGESEETDPDTINDKRSSLKEDLKYLIHNWSWIWVTLASTAVAFCSGSIAVWIPSLLDYASLADYTVPNSAANSIIFGVMATVGGLLGCLSGSFMAQYWRRKAGHFRPDAWVCGISLIVACPMAYIGLNLISYSLPAAWVCVFISMTCLSMNWPVVSDILMYTTIPQRRATAIAIQTLTLHLFGDAAAPFLIGWVSDQLRAANRSDVRHFRDLKYAMYLPTVALVLGGAFFLVASLTIDGDRQRAQQAPKREIFALEPKTEQL